MDDDKEQSDRQAEELGVEAGGVASPDAVAHELDAIKQIHSIEQPDKDSQRCLLDSGSSLRTTVEGSALRASSMSNAKPGSGMQWKEVAEFAKLLKEEHDLLKELQEILEAAKSGRGLGVAIRLGKVAVEHMELETATAPEQLDSVPNATTVYQRVMNSRIVNPKTCLP